MNTGLKKRRYWSLATDYIINYLKNNYEFDKNKINESLHFNECYSAEGSEEYVCNFTKIKRLQNMIYERLFNYQTIELYFYHFKNERPTYVFCLPVVIASRPCPSTSSNNLGSDGASAIASPLSLLTSLHTVNLRSPASPHPTPHPAPTLLLFDCD